MQFIHVLHDPFKKVIGRGVVKIPNIGLNKDEKSIFVLVKFKCLTLGISDMFTKHKVLFNWKFSIFKFLRQDLSFTLESRLIRRLPQGPTYQ